MEWKPDQKKTVTRLLLCAGASAALLFLPLPGEDGGEADPDPCEGYVPVD